VPPLSLATQLRWAEFHARLAGPCIRIVSRARVGFVFRIVGRRSPLHRSSRIRIHLQLSGQGRPETARTNPLGSSVNILPHPHDVRLNMTSVALKATLPPRDASDRRPTRRREREDGLDPPPALARPSSEKAFYRPRAQHSSGRRFGQDGLQGDFAPFRFGIVLATPRSGVSVPVSLTNAPVSVRIPSLVPQRTWPYNPAALVRLTANRSRLRW
jgi:hypothetical protein